MAIAQEVAGAFAARLDEREQLADYLRHAPRVAEDGSGSVLAEATHHALSVPGKLLRPMLLLEACRAAGGRPEDAFPAAAGTEYGHLASLVHDDIIDGDAERRGQPSVCAQYGEAMAILTGDLLIFQTFLSYTECLGRGVPADRVVEAIRILSTTCIELCEGQALEAAIAGDLDTDEAAYRRVMRLKTASVSRAAAEIGAVLAGARPEAVSALGSYGENLGMSFQIVDDLLCFEGPAERLGTPVDSDLRNGRVTLPLIYAIQDGGPAAREQVATILSPEGRSRPGARDRLTEVVRATGALRRARAVASWYGAQARASLEELPPSPARQRLSALAGALLQRDR